MNESISVNPLIQPYVNDSIGTLLASAERRDELNQASIDWPSWDLVDRQLLDLELLLNGALTPLNGYLTKTDHDSVRDAMQLADGTAWPLPIVLDITEEMASKVAPGSSLALRDAEGLLIALLHVEQLWRPDLVVEARARFETDDLEHLQARRWREATHPVFVGGRVEGLTPPVHHDFREMRRSPIALREELERRGGGDVVAIEPSGLLHRADIAQLERLAELKSATPVVQATVELAGAGDRDHYARIEAVRRAVTQGAGTEIVLNLVPLPSLPNNDRGRSLRAILHRNYGVSHLVVARAENGATADRRVEGAIGVTMIEGSSTSNEQTDPDIRRCLDQGEPLPESFTFPQVEPLLRRIHPPRSERGFTLFFTGFSGSGKSTIANRVLVKLLERMDERQITLLDGDMVRKHLSSELGFSKEHRNINIRRIGYVASEITKNGGIAICAPIAPYRNVREQVRRMVEGGGGFVLVHVDTPIEVCEARDRKGLYAKARAGIIKEFTGISDPYETPDDAELVLKTAASTPEAAASAVIEYLSREGYLGANH